jgi:hypothetical protein
MMNPVCVKLPTQSSIIAMTPVGMCSGENQLLDLYDANNMPLTTYYRYLAILFKKGLIRRQSPL